MTEGVEFLKRFGLIVREVAGCVPRVMEDPQMSHVLVAMLYRAEKIILSQLNETCAFHGDFQLVFDRMLTETMVDFGYLSTNGTPALRAFVSASIRGEREARETIRTRVADRYGIYWPTEERMSASLDDKVKLAGELYGVTSDELDGDWPDAFERFRSLGYVEAYAGYRAASRDVHGTWSSLLHSCMDANAAPIPGSRRPRPQPLMDGVMLPLLVLERFASARADRDGELQRLTGAITALETEGVDLIRDHEAWLSINARGGPLP